jgi:protein TonB
MPRLNAPAQEGRVRVGRDGVKPPLRTFNVPPKYPEEAQAAHVQGVVILQITIGEDGSVIDAAPLRSIPELDQAAINAALQWQYEPTLLNGQPVEVEMTVTFNFTLR